MEPTQQNGTGTALALVVILVLVLAGVFFFVSTNREGVEEASSISDALDE